MSKFSFDLRREFSASFWPTFVKWLTWSGSKIRWTSNEKSFPSMWKLKIEQFKMEMRRKENRSRKCENSFIFARFMCALNEKPRMIEYRWKRKNNRLTRRRKNNIKPLSWHFMWPENVQTCARFSCWLVPCCCEWLILSSFKVKKDLKG